MRAPNCGKRVACERMSSSTWAGMRRGRHARAPPARTGSCADEGKTCTHIEKGWSAFFDAVLRGRRQLCCTASVREGAGVGRGRWPAPPCSPVLGSALTHTADGPAHVGRQRQLSLLTARGGGRWWLDGLRPTGKSAVSPASGRSSGGGGPRRLSSPKQITWRLHAAMCWARRSLPSAHSGGLPADPCAIDSCGAADGLPHAIFT